jgi:hypothetical protein
MERLYFHVSLEGTRWRVRRDGAADALEFVRQADAIDAAMGAAKAQWEMRGIASGVKFHVPRGGIEVKLFGEVVADAE